MDIIAILQQDYQRFPLDQTYDIYADGMSFSFLSACIVTRNSSASFRCFCAFCLHICVDQLVLCRVNLNWP